MSTYQFNFDYLFSYRPLFYESEGRPMLTEPRPALPVILHNGSRNLQVMALIDSGSTFSLFDYKIGEELGLEVRAGKLQRLSSLGGTITGYEHAVEMEVAENLRFIAQVLFSDDAIPRNLLGHIGFISNVRLCLRGRVGQIYLGGDIG